jgi:hypothetical protein
MDERSPQTKRNHDELSFLSRRIEALMNDALQERTRDVVQLTEPDERGLTVLVTREAVEIRLATIDWISHARTASSLFWKRIPWRRLEGEGLAAALSAAREARARQFKPCRRCKVLTPPERKIDARLCHSCSEAAGSREAAKARIGKCIGIFARLGRSQRAHLLTGPSDQLPILISSASPNSLSAVLVSCSSCSEMPPVGATATITLSFSPFVEKREKILL